MDERYDPTKIEPAWQAEWDRTNLYLTREDPGRPKFYILEMFPYPSGAGLSVGHLHNYVPCDVVGRYKRMAGFNVLHPMGWDAFGLPAENEAVLKGLHPTETVPRYAANFKRQLKLSGCAYDWSREINSSSPEYYKWTQWFFLMLHKRGLAYRAKGAQWWCDKCGTVLANEQVINGCCWRHTDNPVSKRDLEQWYIKITEYADRLLADLDGIDWPEAIKLMQRNWIGRSEGAELAFPVAGHPGKEVRFFTTRPDTVFGVSFMVLAPEHPLVAEITTDAQRAKVESYAADARRQTEIERMSTAKEKSGVFTGAYAHNVFTDKDIPIWIADYVLMGYGTGAIMAAPGEDQRDFEFATKYGLPIPRVTASADGSTPPADRAFPEPGVAINSGFLNGKKTAEAITAVCQYAEKNGIGRATINHRMRDWLISRQRYWGCPIPIVYCKTDGIVPVPEDQLPVLLPPMKDYLPPGTGRSPLANVPEFVNTTCPKCGGPAERETDTLDTFACSSWYFLRFTSPHEDQRPFDRRAVDYWLPVDLYVGGAEHAVMHLLYARMWTKVMFDEELIGFDEPFPRLRNQGVVWASDGQRMSKSKGNIVTPDAMIEKYGADALRLWELFMSPFDEATNWNESGVAGTLRFIQRVWTMMRRYVESSSPAGTPSEETLKRTHKTIQLVTDHIERLRFNTAIAAMMDHLNHLAKLKPDEMGRFAAESFLLLLAPMAPHVTEEIWRALGHTSSIHLEPWPTYDPNLVRDEMVTVVVQVNGKVRDRLPVPAGASEADIRQLALNSEAVRRHLNGKTPSKFIFIKDKMLSIVTKNVERSPGGDHMPTKRQDELRELLDDPNETLENEYKSWIDLSDPETRADLARHLAALANHGGGRIIVGFADDLKYAGSNLYSAVTWDRDAISSIVKKYLEPTFQCDVFGVKSETGNEHPIVLVPPHGAVPICSKADGPMVNGKIAGIRNSTYYIRKPGPESAPIISSEEWRALIRRCVLNERTALLAAIDASLRGSIETPTSDEILRKWHDAAYAKYVQNVGKFKAPSELVQRNFQLSYLIQTQDGQHLDPNQLRETLMRVNVEVHDLVHTGWSMFYVFTVPEVAASFSVDPTVDQGNQDFLECSLLADISKRGFGADTWRVATDGRATLIRDYWEDEGFAAATTGMKPGSWFSPNMMARSLAEFVRHARGFAEKFDVPTNVVFRCEWRDLAGRMVFDPNVLWRSGQKSNAESRIVTAAFPIAELKNSWADIVAELGSPLARLFGIGEVFTPQWVAGQAPTWLR